MRGERECPVGGKFYEGWRSAVEQPLVTASHLDPFNPLAGLDAIAGIKNYFLPFLQAFEHLRFSAARAPCLHGTELCAAFAEDERSPVRPAAKQRARRNFQSAVGLPNNDSGFDAEVVAEAATLFNGSDDVSDNVDTLFLNAKRGDFGKRGGLDETHTSFEGCLTAPMFEEDARAGSDGRAIAGKCLDDNFKIGRVADFHQRRAGG